MTCSRTAVGNLVLIAGICATTLMATTLGDDAMEDNRNVIEQWSEVKPPEPPEIHKVLVEPQTTALLILDIEKLTTNVERRPRAVAAVPRIARLLERARANGVFVAYSTTSRGTPGDILQAVAPAKGDPVVRSSVDKFFRTDLERHLSDRGIKTVVIVGTAAEGAVLHTAAAACMRSLDVVVPVDGMPSSTLYAEQYVCWHLANAPGSRRRTTLCRTELIDFRE